LLYYFLIDKMSIKIDNYFEKLKDAKPTHYEKQTVHPPPGSMADIKIIPSKIIPPINTNIQFDVLSQFNLSEHPHIAEMSIEEIPEIFNWHNVQSTDSEEIKRKKLLISKPGDQKLCGSCWAISAAGIVADNFVVSGIVDWDPNLSTTWCLSCYPQGQCQGGNPAQLFLSISENGIATNHCIDYSWCDENDLCNGSALKHFKASQSGEDPSKTNLSTLIPNCGCYFSDVKHYLFKTDPDPKSIYIGASGVDENNIASVVKKHIYVNGPVMGGFLVFNNFMKGTFSNMNGGVYLENGLYDGSDISFASNQTSSDNYVGSHAIAIIGWGVEKNVVIDNKGTKNDVPYWYCRNSWTDKWGDNGYFKFAMYPYNKISVFEKQITINTKSGNIMGGGMVFLSASVPPEKMSLKQIEAKYMSIKRLNNNSYYQSDPAVKAKLTANQINYKKIITYVFLVTLIIIVIIAILSIVSYFRKRYYSPTFRRYY
jgi:hypothetical protein